MTHTDNNLTNNNDQHDNDNNSNNNNHTSQSNKLSINNSSNDDDLEDTTQCNTSDNQCRSRLYSDKQVPESTILYFGFGSNMLPSILTNKKVEVLHSIPAFIPAIKLRFNLSTKSIVEPSYANLVHLDKQKTNIALNKFNNIIKQTNNDTSQISHIIQTYNKQELCTGVHGVVHELLHSDMSRMDLLEGNGQSYQREEFDAYTYNGNRIRVFAYICKTSMTSFITLEDKPPSLRYLKVLINGSKHFKLNKTYIEWLQQHIYTPLPEYKLTNEQIQAINSRSITYDELSQHAWKPEYDDIPANDTIHFDPPIWTCLKGVVFDICNLDFPNTYKKMFCGSDSTFFWAGRVAVEHDTEYENNDNNNKDQNNHSNGIQPDNTKPELSQPITNVTQHNKHHQQQQQQQHQQQYDPHTIPTTVDELLQCHKEYINAVIMDFIHQGSIIVGHITDYHKYKF